MRVRLSQLFRSGRSRRSSRAFRPGDPRNEGQLEVRQVPATVPPGFTVSMVVDGLIAPSAMDIAPDGRLFIAEQPGTVRVVEDGVLLPTPFVTVPVSVEAEQGLSGIVLDPEFETNGFVYLYYTTTTTPRRNQVIRFSADGNIAVPGSEVVILQLPPINPRVLPFHNGGAMHFGPDGKLYVGVGDHKQSMAAQNPRSPFGKILRINPDGSIPEDNPFFQRAQGLGRAVWALGLRNPFTMAFQPETSRLFANDVGQATWEEVNAIVPSGNYGWPLFEGPSAGPRFQAPLHAYRHGNGPGQGCAVVGGVFYPMSGPFPDEHRGAYYFGEYCQAEIRQLDPDTGAVNVFASGLTPWVVDLDIGPDGALYHLARGDLGSLGQVHRIAFETEQPPSLSSAPVDQLVSLGRSATFRVSGVGGAAPLAYQWQRDGVDIPGAIGPEYTIPPATIDDHGARFRVVVSNPFGSATSEAATLFVTENQPPVPSILTPTPNQRWRLGQRINFSGVGLDPEDGVLPPSAFTWWVDLHHDDHAHPFRAPVTGITEGSFVIPRAPHDQGVIWYRVYLSVQDSQGLSTTTWTDLQPVRFPRAARR